MRKSSYPTRIRLDEVSENGDDFVYTSESGEISASLKDLIGDHKYNVKIHLKPMGNVYEITCDFETSMDLHCSRCGRLTATGIHDNSHELLVIEKSRPRNAKSAGSRSETTANSGPFCNYIESINFDLAEFIHEQIASNEPFIVECGKEDCFDLVESLQTEVKLEKANPFEVLKDLKL